MIRSFVCVKSFSLNRFNVSNCARLCHSIDIEVEDHVISKQDFRKYFSRLYTAKP